MSPALLTRPLHAQHAVARPAHRPQPVSACCLCNFERQDAVNARLLTRRCGYYSVDRVLDPRPESVSTCATTAAAAEPRTAYRAAESVGKLSTSDASTALRTPAQLCDDHPASVHTQLAALKAAETTLQGHGRSVIHEWRGRDAPLKEVMTCQAFEMAMPLRVGPGTGPARCPAFIHAAQTRAPLQPHAPRSPDLLQPPAKQRPSRTDAARAHAWKDSLPYDRLECWRWNDHPFVLNAYGVARCEQGRGCSYEAAIDDRAARGNLFGNSTRRKMLAGR